MKPGGVDSGCADVSYIAPELLVPSGPYGLAIVGTDDAVCCDAPGCTGDGLRCGVPC